MLVNLFLYCFRFPTKFFELLCLNHTVLRTNCLKLKQKKVFLLPGKLSKPAGLFEGYEFMSHLRVVVFFIYPTMFLKLKRARGYLSLCALTQLSGVRLSISQVSLRATYLTGIMPEPIFGFHNL